jgi:hypothetical protein
VDKGIDKGLGKEMGNETSAKVGEVLSDIGPEDFES